MMWIALVLAAVVVVWYAVTVAVLTGCGVAGDTAASPGGPQQPRTAAALTWLRSAIVHARDDLDSGSGRPPHHALVPSTGGRAVASAPLPADPRVTALTARLLGALQREDAVGRDPAGDAAFNKLAAQLAARVIGAEDAGLMPVTDDVPALSPSKAVSPSPRAAAKPGGESSGPNMPTADEFSQQTCYLQTDESEICTYDNLICYDGRSPVVVVEQPVRVPERIVDYTHFCVDFRYYEPSAMEYSGCAYKFAFERAYNKTALMLPAVDFPLPLMRRRWGPQNRNGHLYFKEVAPEEVWGPPTEAGIASGARDDREHGSPGVSGDPVGADPALGEWLSPSGRYSAPLAIAEPFESDYVRGLPLLRRTVVGNRTIDWLDGSLWLAGIDGQFWQNPFHWWSKIGVLFDALRSNATPAFGEHPADGYLQWQANGRITGGSGSIVRSQETHNRMAFKQGAQWPMPPMDTVLFTGDGAVVLDNVDALSSWFRRTLQLATQPHSRHYFNDLLKELNDHHFLCATRGAMPGVKNKFFTGRSDAWMWRQYAYAATGLLQKGYASHPKYPPRKVTIIDRKGLNGRGIFNKDELLEAVAATGLPYQLVPNMAALSFDQQVELMAGTGILIAPHGAHLTNAMFLPQHAVLIELFPYLLKKNTYRHLAQMADLNYLPYYSWELLGPEYNRTVYGVALMQEGYYWVRATLRPVFASLCATL